LLGFWVKFCGFGGGFFVRSAFSGTSRRVEPDPFVPAGRVVQAILSA
jgi:hypothetical protein